MKHSKTIVLVIAILVLIYPLYVLGMGLIGLLGNAYGTFVEEESYKVQYPERDPRVTHEVRNPEYPDWDNDKIMALSIRDKLWRETMDGSDYLPPVMFDI
jgi:hypothetical protein